MADFLAGANQSLQENLSRGEPGIFAAYRMIGSILLLGSGGYGVDRWLATGPWGLLTGLLAGIVAGLYGLIASTRP
jgi:F0F1-type ATP synthase assembly protein I